MIFIWLLKTNQGLVLFLHFGDISCFFKILQGSALAGGDRSWSCSAVRGAVLHALLRSLGETPGLPCHFQLGS